MRPDLLPAECVLCTGRPTSHSPFNRQIRNPWQWLPVVVVGLASTRQGLQYAVVMGGVLAVALLFEWLQLHSVRYTVTDQRVIFETHIFGGWHRSEHLGALDGPVIITERSGVGAVRFGTGWRSNRRASGIVPLEPRAIDNVEHVRALIITAMGER